MIGECVGINILSVKAAELVADIMKEKCTVGFCDWSIPAKWCRFCSKSVYNQKEVLEVE
jgi:hypothetical protein